MKLEKLKPLVNNPLHYDALMEYVTEKLETARLTIERADKDVLLYREQGKIEILKKLLSLRDEVNGRTKNSGTYQPNLPLA